MSEHQPLLSPHEHTEITFKSSLKYTLFSSKVNVLLIFVPIAFALSGASDSIVFTMNFIAIIPLAKLLGFATEEIALRAGSVLGSLLNATFGNAVELILGMIALKEGLVRVVQASILGSILSNILLITHHPLFKVLGCCFLLGGWNRSEQEFNATVAQTSTSLLGLTTLSLLIPAAFSATTSGTSNELTSSGIINLSHGTAIVLLIVYILYLVFQLKTHTEQFQDVADDDEEPHTSLAFSVITLLLIACLIAFHAEHLVGAIEGVVEVWGLNETFVGLIILPIVGNAAEHVSSVTFAMKNKMNLCIGIAISSSIQIGLLVCPILVLTGWIISIPMTFFFEIFETVVLFSSVLIVNYLIADGKSNWLEGALLLAVYAIVAMAFYYHPEV
ncbi:calcium/proton exchanger [Backusella circina FSU 941]|nr:calcium/proton exchanger [Backusella circina FSU 941]